MTKNLFITLIFLPFGACGSQQIYSNNIFFENICNKPVSIILEKDTNHDLPRRSIEIPAGQKLVIGSYSSYGESVHQQIDKNYSLTIVINDSLLKIDKQMLLLELQTASYSEHRFAREWLVKNPALCPPFAKSRPPEQPGSASSIPR